MAPILEIRDLSFTYEGAQSPIFEHLSLAVEEGSHILLKGASGTGKSSLLRLICRLAAPTSGTILYRGEPITGIAPPKLRSAVGYVAQIPRMTDGSVKENLLLPFTFALNRERRTPDEDALRRMLSDFYLDGLKLTHPALKLSTGQQQRLALMRTLLLKPDLLLLDEPTSALDAESARMVFTIMERLNTRERKTLVTVTHSDYRPSGAHVQLYLLQNRTLTRQP
jgi:putative ABC transport system ATP-binding protein